MFIAFHFKPWKHIPSNANLDSTTFEPKFVLKEQTETWEIIFEGVTLESNSNLCSKSTSKLCQRCSKN